MAKELLLCQTPIDTPEDSAIAISKLTIAGRSIELDPPFILSLHEGLIIRYADVRTVTISFQLKEGE